MTIDISKATLQVASGADEGIQIRKATLQVGSWGRPPLQVSQSYITAVGNLPSASVQNALSHIEVITEAPAGETRQSQGYVTTLTGGASLPVQNSQSYITVIGCGRQDDPKIRVWTYTQDGHDFYIIRLGEEETLVYDTYSEQWYTWGSGTSNLWKAVTGINWLGADFWGANYGSNVVVGDHTNGSLYFLDPDESKDDHTTDEAIQNTFERQFQGQVVKRGYDRERCYSVMLEGSTGEQNYGDFTGIQLEYSDDQGNSYVDAGTVTVNQEEYDTRVFWRSLGSFPSPGRLFRFTDDGDFARIDFITMDRS